MGYGAASTDPLTAVQDVDGSWASRSLDAFGAVDEASTGGCALITGRRRTVAGPVLDAGC